MKKRTLSLLMAALFLFSILSGAVFAAPDDSTLSQHIKEADGTSGQNTNDGSGIKTGHIQDGAVTTSKVADGAVTDSKITGPISASKIQSTGFDADTVDGKHAADLAPVVHSHSQADVNGLDTALSGKADINHNHDGFYQKKYANVITVAKSGGDFDNPVDAMNSITDASASNPYLVKIMPGVYNISSPVTMKSHVDMAGSGRGTTVISSEFFSPVLSISYMQNIEVRDLTIENLGNFGGTWSLASYIDSSTGIYFTGVDISAYGGWRAVGVYSPGSDYVFTNVGIYAENSADMAIGILANGGILSLNGVTASVTAGVMKDGAWISAGMNGLGEVNIDLRNSDLYGNGFSLGGSNTATFKVYSSTLRGAAGALLAWHETALMAAGAEIGNGIQYEWFYGTPAKLVNCFDGNFTPIPNQ